ncbi:hypothetical protein ACFY7C_03070 [Streptomyces sp. NPDC012769]|uniref:hypothetical protein n=1 Tax=Streptomyces sp. NPDC012769 TaxID=3364848 RepID=UPI00368DA531
MSGIAGTYVPRPHFGSRYQTVIPAPLETVWTAWRTMEQPGGEGWGPVVRALFALRGWLGRWKNGRDQASMTENGLRSGFLLLAEDAPREIVRGIVGQWWTMGAANGRPDVTDARAFAAFDEPGYAKATFSMRFTPDPATGGTKVVTETRVLCLDDTARRAMGRYWRLIRPFSGLVRLLMLRRLRQRALG